MIVEDWIKVEDALPPYEETVLVAFMWMDEVCYGWARRTEKEDVQKDKNQFASLYETDITHWQKMVPPKID